MKQKKQDKKKGKSDNGNEDEKNGHDLEEEVVLVDNEELKVKVKDNLPKREEPTR